MEDKLLAFANKLYGDSIPDEVTQATRDHTTNNIDKVTDEFFDNVSPLLAELTDEWGRTYEPTDAQVPLLSDRTRFQVWLMGRRAGKSKTAAKRAIIEALKPNRRIWIVAPTYQLSEKIYREFHSDVTRNLASFLKGVPKNSKNEMTAQFITGSVVTCKSADDPNQLVGDSLDLVIADEAAMIKDLAIDLLIPALSDINPATGKAKGKLIAVSTPREHNWFKDMYDRGCLAPEIQIERYGDILYSSHHATSFSNPYIDHEAINAEAKRMPESLWRQEFLAQFMTEGGLVFPIKKSAFFPPGFRSPKHGQVSYCGLDLARANDYTVFVGLNSRFEQIAYKRINKTDWSVIIAQIKEAIEELAYFGPVVLCVDETGVGSPIYEELRNYFMNNSFVRIVPVNFGGSGSVKNNLIEELKLKISDNLIKFWDNQEIYEEFRDYAFIQDKKGKVTYQAPKNKHDDIVTAVALAVYASHNGPPVLIVV